MIFITLGCAYTFTFIVSHEHTTDAIPHAVKNLAVNRVTAPQDQHVAFAVRPESILRTKATTQSILASQLENPWTYMKWSRTNEKPPVCIMQDSQRL